jgi:hypothetical protein
MRRDAICIIAAIGLSLSGAAIVLGWLLEGGRVLFALAGISMLTGGLFWIQVEFRR